MFSSSSLPNGTASSCFNPTQHHNHQKACNYPSIYSHQDIAHGCILQCFDPVAAMVVKDAEDDQVPFSSTTTTSTPSFGNTSNSIMPASVTKKKPHNRSKVRTAQGLRDRRVRLSIGIARKFFDLQDMLGFDKPSRTLEWLFTKSSAAIEELLSAASLPSTTSSEFETTAPDTGDVLKMGLSPSSQTAPGNRDTSPSTEQVSVYDDALATKKREAALLLAKESRKKARARARFRTLEKLKLSHQNCSNLLNVSELESVDPTTSNLSALGQDQISTSYMRSLESGSCKEERRKGEEQQQYEHKQQLQRHEHNDIYGFQTNYVQESTYVMMAGGLPNLSLDWTIRSTIPRPSSFTAHQLIWPSREFGVYSRPSLDYLCSNHQS